MNLSSTDKKEFVVQELKNLTENLKIVNFEVSLSGINDDRFSDMEEKVLGINDNQNIGEEIKSECSDEIYALERIVFAEAQTKNIYVLPQRRFHSDYLIRNQDKLFEDGVFEKFSELAQYDIKSSCRCLLFGESTASAFHILRATEAVLKDYYLHHIKRKRLKNPMWKAMLCELRRKKQKKPPTVLLNSLDLVRESYRNPTQHPDAIYDINSAQDLFGVCLDVLGKMANEL